MSTKTRKEMVEETRAKLITAGRKAFAEKGYSGASMDDLTAAAGLTRGALYHNFGDKKGLLQAVIDQLDTEILARLALVQAQAATPFEGLVEENVAFIEMALDPEVQRIMLLDGPAVLGDPSQWPNQTACLRRAADLIRGLVEAGTLKPVDPEATARLLNGAALSASLWVAAADEPQTVLRHTVAVFRELATGLLKQDASQAPATS